MVQKLGPVNSVWAVRLSADHGAVAECRLAGRQGQGATHLAEGGVESAAETEAPGALVWRNDGSCVRLRPERANHVWSYDFVSAMTHDGRTLRMLTLIDE